LQEIYQEAVGKLGCSFEGEIRGLDGAKVEAVKMARVVLTCWAFSSGVDLLEEERDAGLGNGVRCVLTFCPSKYGCKRS
jgi:hypothetical protein